MRRTIRDFGLAAAAVALALVAAGRHTDSSVALHAQQASAPGPLVPLTAASVARDLDRYLGVNASMMASVETVLSKTVFTVDQNKSNATGQEVVVIAPTLQDAPQAGDYLTVQGIVFRFDPIEVIKRAQGYTLDLPLDVIAKYRGKPALIATAVINDKLMDLAKVPVRPMTAEEKAFSALMQSINPAFMTVRGGLDEPNAAAMRTELQTLRQAFTEVQTFFKGRGTTDAAAWATESLGLVAKVEAALAGGKLDELKASVGGLQQLCSSCHNAHRERMDDGTFRIRGGQ